MRDSIFFYLSACLLAVTMTLNIQAVEAVTGKIVSCPAWTLNKHKELRIFLKGDNNLRLPVGEINNYAGIEIQWKRGKKAILSIFDDENKHIEDVKLYELQTRTEMHKLMVDKGFVKKTENQKKAELQEAVVEKQLKVLEQHPVVYGNVAYLYFVAFFVVGVFGFDMFGKKRVRRSFQNSPLVRV